MPYPKHIVSEIGDAVCIPVSIPRGLIPHLIGAIHGLTHNYAYDRNTDEYLREISKISFNEVIGQLAMNTDCCDMIADCIDNSDIVQNAIDNFLANNSTVISNIYKKFDTIAWRNMASVSSDNCDDRRWAGIVRVINKLNQNNVDFLQVLTDQNNDVFERVQNIANSIPAIAGVVQVVGANGWIDFTQNLVTDFYDEYVARDTENLRRDLACDIFCMTDGCELTIEAFYTAIADRLPADVLTALGESLYDALSYFVLGGFGTDNFYFIMYAVQLLVYGIGDSWFDIDAVGIEIEYIAGSNDPNDEHLLYCDCSPIYTIFVTFDDGTYPHYTLSGTGTGNNTPRLSNQGAPNYLQAYAGSVNGSYEIRVTVDLNGSYEVSQIDFDRRTYGFGYYEVVGIEPNDNEIVLRSGSGSTNEPSYETIATPITPTIFKAFYVRWYGTGAGSVWAFLDNIEADIKDIGLN